jgi:hypothetical protein
VFRPYWDVTPSIQRNEIVPHIQKDPNYIAKHNFEVVTPKGEVVTDNQGVRRFCREFDLAVSWFGKSLVQPILWVW